MKYRTGWIALLVLAALTPLGILAGAGAWGEWGLEGVRERAGFVPQGMRGHAARTAESPLADDTVPGLERGFGREALGTVATGLLGAGATALLALALAKAMKHGRDS